MISPRVASLRVRAVLLGTALFAAAAVAAAPDADTLIGKLVRPAPASVAFAEVRFSPLLTASLVVAGELDYGGPASLDRRVLRPYVESTSIRGDSVRVEREGEPPRSFALRRAPELRGLLTGFSALLAGDPAALRREFDVAASGGDDAWTLTLTPLDASAQRRLERIVVTGGGAEPRCFATIGARGAASVLLLGGAANADLAPDVTLEGLLDYCRAE